MSERDDLARLMFITDNSEAKDPVGEWEFCKRHDSLVEYVYDMADAILAAGYTKG